MIVEVDKKMAPIKPFGTTIFMGVGKDGKGYASEHVSNQSGLFDDQKLPDNVTKIPEKEAKAQ